MSKPPSITFSKGGRPILFGTVMLRHWAVVRITFLMIPSVFVLNPQSLSMQETSTSNRADWYSFFQMQEECVHVQTAPT